MIRKLLFAAGVCLGLLGIGAQAAEATPTNGGYNTTCNNDPGDVCSSWTSSATYAGQPIQYNTVWRHVFVNGVARWQTHVTQWWVGANPHPIGDIAYTDTEDNIHPCMEQTGPGPGGHLRFVGSYYASSSFDFCTSGVIDWRPCNLLGGYAATQVDAFYTNQSTGNWTCFDGHGNWVASVNSWSRSLFLDHWSFGAAANPPFPLDRWAQLSIDDGT